MLNFMHTLTLNTCKQLFKRSLYYEMILTVEKTLKTEVLNGEYHVFRSFVYIFGQIL